MNFAEKDEFLPIILEMMRFAWVTNVTQGFA